MLQIRSSIRSIVVLGLYHIYSSLPNCKSTVIITRDVVGILMGRKIKEISVADAAWGGLISLVVSHKSDDTNDKC